MYLRHDLSVRRFLVWKIGPQQSLPLFNNPQPAGIVKAAALGFSPLTAFLDWLFSESWHISFQTSSLIRDTSGSDERACASAEQAGSVFTVLGFPFLGLSEQVISFERATMSGLRS
jgi:hypothetical protein